MVLFLIFSRANFTVWVFKSLNYLIFQFVSFLYSTHCRVEKFQVVLRKFFLYFVKIFHFESDEFAVIKSLNSESAFSLKLFCFDSFKLAIHFFERNQVQKSEVISLSDKHIDDIIVSGEDETDFTFVQKVDEVHALSFHENELVFFKAHF